MKEEVFRYGENNQGIGVLTLPADDQDSPIVVLLNSGLLHRAEPYRLNVLAARQFASLGYIALRVDLAGKGDTPARPELNNRESVALDWSFIKSALKKRFQVRPVIVFGLCSGADNGIKLCVDDDEIRGLVLLDPISPRDEGFVMRSIVDKIRSSQAWKNAHKSIFRRFTATLGIQKSPAQEQLMLRDMPTEDDNRGCFKALVERDGRALAVFTSHAFHQYNRQGQFARALKVGGLESICAEEFWPEMLHLYPNEDHRQQLLDRVGSWANENLSHFQATRSA